MLARLRAHERGARHADRRRASAPSYMRLLEGGSGSPEMQDDGGEGRRGGRRLPEGGGLLQAKRPRAGRGAGAARRSRPTRPRPTTTRCSRGSLSLKPENQSNEKAARVDPDARQGDLDERPLREGASSGAGCSTSASGSPSRPTGISGRAVDLNPHNIDAAREVRLHNMRGGPRGRSSSPPANRRSSPRPGKALEGRREGRAPGPLLQEVERLTGAIEGTRCSTMCPKRDRKPSGVVWATAASLASSAGSSKSPALRRSMYASRCGSDRCRCRPCARACGPSAGP